MIKQEYDRLVSSGELFKMYPEAVGDFEQDCDYIFLEERKKLNTTEKDPRHIDVYEIWCND